MIDNLEDAISHAREVAEKQYKRSYELHDKAVELDKNGLDSNEVREEGKACFSCYYEHCQLADWLEELAERRKADKWISVKERMPETCVAVMVYCPEYKNQYCAFYDGTHWQVFGAYDTVWNEVTHWKPLSHDPEESEVENG